MPLFREFTIENTRVWIWKYEEDESEGVNLISTALQNDGNKKWHPNRCAEIYMIRKMMENYLSPYKILYQENGAPYLDPPDFKISISHTFPYAAIAVSRNPVGIDLEKIKNKILKIEHKFILNEVGFLPENTAERIEYLTIIWNIKEALYKMHHSKFWSLKKHYEVKPFTLDNLQNIQCKVYNDEFCDEFVASVQRIENLFFSLVKPQKK